MQPDTLLDFKISSAGSLPLPAKALTVSQPVKACNPGSAAETDSPRAFEMFDILTYLVLV